MPHEPPVSVDNASRHAELPISRNDGTTVHGCECFDVHSVDGDEPVLAQDIADIKTQLEGFSDTFAKMPSMISAVAEQAIGARGFGDGYGLGQCVDVHGFDGDTAAGP